MNMYIETARALPIPRSERARPFAEYVAGAHSWYRYLPMLPLSPFVFYLDPNARRSMVDMAGSGLNVVEADRPWWLGIPPSLTGAGTAMVSSMKILNPGGLAEKGSARMAEFVENGIRLIEPIFDLFIDSREDVAAIDAKRARQIEGMQSAMRRFEVPRGDAARTQ